MRPLKIAIDGNEANTDSHVGSNVYALNLLRSLEKLTKKQDHISWTVLLSEPKKSCLPKRRKGWRYQIIGPKPFWTQWALPLHLFRYRHRYEVFFSPGHYAPRLCSLPYISSVMDTAYIPYPDQFKASDTLKLTNWTKYSVEKAKKVLTISEFTKSEVHKYYHKPNKDIFVAYPAHTDNTPAPNKTKSNKLLKKLGVRAPYILYVGTIQPRKNLVRLISAFEIFIDMYKKSTKTTDAKKLPQLVIAGKIGWLADDVLKKIKLSKHHALIITPGYVDNQTKLALYSQAKCSTLVGLYEGFGMPPLESMAYGCVPVVSNTSSLPEAVGKAGVTVDPLDPNSIALGLHKVMTMKKKEYAVWRKKGREQLQKFSWNKAALSTLEALYEITRKS